MVDIPIGMHLALVRIDILDKIQLAPTMVYTPLGTHGLGYGKHPFQNALDPSCSCQNLGYGKCPCQMHLNLGMIYAHGLKTHLVDQYIINNSSKGKPKSTMPFK